MDKKKITRVLGVLYAISAIVLLYLGYSYFKKPKESSEGPSTSVTVTPMERTGDNPIPKPQFASQYADKPTAKIQFGLSAFPSFPTAERTYEIKGDTYSDEQITKLATQLGFSQKPTVYDSKIDGKTYIYSDENAGSLRIEAKNRIIDYKSVNAPTETLTGTIDKNDIAKSALDYLAKLTITDTNALTITSATAITIDELGSQKPHNAINTMFEKKINDLPLYASTFNTGIVTVTLNSKKEVIAFYIDDIGDLSEKGSYAIKDEKEFKDTLEDATIQSLSSKQITSEYDTTVFDVKNVIVTQIELAYVQDANQNILQPVFVLKGTATLNNGARAQAVLYLPALSQKQ